MKKKIGSFLRLLARILMSSSPLILSSKLFFLKDPPVWPDESVFLEIARNFAQTGKMSSEIFGNAFLGMKDIAFGYPPLYFFLLAIWTNIFGSTIESIRTLSFIFAISSLILFYFIARQILQSNWFSGLGVFILSADNHFARASRTGRMEIFVFFFSLLSFILFFIAEKKQKTYLYFLAGLGAALASLFHTMGFIAVATLVITAISSAGYFKNKLIKIIHIIIPVILLNTIWIFSIWPQVNYLFAAYTSQAQNKTSKLPYFLHLISFDSSWRILFLSLAIILLLFIFKFSKIMQNYRSFVLVGFFVAAVMIFIGKEGVYILYFQPFITLIMLLLIQHYKKNGTSNLFLSVLSLAAFIILNYFNIQYLNNDNIGITKRSNKSIFISQNFDYHDFTKRIAAHIPQDKKLSIYIVGTPDPYFDLKNNPNLSLYQYPSLTTSDQIHKKLLDSSDYIISSWVPNQVVADYINNNSQKRSLIEQPGGYWTMIVDLVPKSQRR